MQIDELIEPRWVIPVEPAGVVLEHHAIALHQGKILALLPVAEARQRYQPTRTTVLPTHVVTPGLVNLHTHAAMTLLRGVGDDLPLHAWLQERIWPTEKALLSHEFVLAGTRMACLEMLRGGITCMNDMYFFPDAAAQAALETGMRASLGITVIDFPTAWGSDPDDYLNKGLSLRDTLRDESTISFTLAPHAPYTIGDETFRRVAELSGQLDMPVHIHLHETQAEIADEIARHGCRPIERIARMGLVGPLLISVHSVHLNAAEIALYAERGVTVAHCPASNLKLASGIAPIAACLDAGVRVGIGTDGVASNNRLDMMAELRLAALLAKGASGRADVFPAHQVLRAATLSAAAGMGLETRIGSIETGKRGDLAAFDLGGIETQPVFDVASHLVFVAGREHVTDVWVDGNPVVQKRQFVKTGAREAEAEGALTLSLWQNRVRVRIDSLH